MRPAKYSLNNAQPFQTTKIKPTFKMRLLFPPLKSDFPTHYLSYCRYV